MGRQRNYICISWTPFETKTIYFNFLWPMHRMAYVRHAFNLLLVGSTPLHVVICFVFVTYVINRNLNWTYAHLLKGTHHRMLKGIFCMAKNLTEVIENIELHQRKEFYIVTEDSIASVILSKAKLLLFLTFSIFNLIAISCLLLSQKSR